jgi:hypothetical protein
MYQEPTALDADNFANFSFAQPTEDINQPLPLPENLLQPAPPSDHRAATDLMHNTHRLMDDLQKLMEQLTVIHNLLYLSNPLTVLSDISGGLFCHVLSHFVLRGF